MAGLLKTIIDFMAGKTIRKKRTASSSSRSSSRTSGRSSRQLTEDERIFREVMRKIRKTGDRRSVSTTERFKRAVESQGFSRAEVNSAVNTYNALKSRKNGVSKTFSVLSAATRDADKNGRADILDFGEALWDRFFDSDDDADEKDSKKN
ncbi:hypothetical protein [Succinimonas amylolytica]|uniref:hypothetical protein n=1 Tax=Succinimonas amylolytica TaxID=83769 RepID=UPI0023A8D792